MKPRRYRLEGRKAVPDESLLAWAEWYERADRRVARTMIPDRLTAPDHLTGKKSPAFVSTVFLGLDHQYLDGPPHLFETCVFMEGPFDREQVRYSTWEEAEAGHAQVVARVTRLTLIQGGKAKES